jgi:hypothetical protein
MQSENANDPPGGDSRNSPDIPFPPPRRVSLLLAEEAYLRLDSSVAAQYPATPARGTANFEARRGSPGSHPSSPRDRNRQFRFNPLGPVPARKMPSPPDRPNSPHPPAQAASGERSLPVTQPTEEWEAFDTGVTAAAMSTDSPFPWMPGEPRGRPQGPRSASFPEFPGNSRRGQRASFATSPPPLLSGDDALQAAVPREDGRTHHAFEERENVATTSPVSMGLRRRLQNMHLNSTGSPPPGRSRSRPLGPRPLPIPYRSQHERRHGGEGSHATRGAPTQTPERDDDDEGPATPRASARTAQQFNEGTSSEDIPMDGTEEQMGWQEDEEDDPERTPRASDPLRRPVLGDRGYRG